ncbi:hypothetical protein [Mucisphaera calidilacus]|uniref:hypothetical protein n=1 Tax=Mucisphaera calidilacus TaxID=2527982 RepID=UPI0011A4D54F|nr:hypothetical protein [Mucisphaera calidilacus]
MIDLISPTFSDATNLEVFQPWDWDDIEFIPIQTDPEIKDETISHDLGSISGGSAVFDNRPSPTFETYQPTDLIFDPQYLIESGQILSITEPLSLTIADGETIFIEPTGPLACDPFEELGLSGHLIITTID